MTAFTSIALEKLPSPQIIEALDYETIVGQMIAQFRDLAPAYSNILASDPAYKLLEIAAYRELLLRARINDAAKGVMLAYAQGNDLEHLAALFGVERQLLDPGNPDTYPPVEPTYETDDRLRQRTQLALEGYTTAGSVGSYVFWGLGASGDVKDIDVQSPIPGRVVVTVLSRLGDGSPSASLLDTVSTAINADTVRPLTDEVIVQAAAIQHYRVEADLYFYRGPDSATVLAAAESALAEYVAARHALGHDITESGLHAALHQPGVQRAELKEPVETLVIAPQSAAYCTEIVLHNKGTDE